MKHAVAVAAVVIASTIPWLGPGVSAKDNIPKKRLRDGVYTSPGGEFTLKVPQLITPGARSEERQLGAASWGVFFTDDFGHVYYVLRSDQKDVKPTLDQLTADIQVGSLVRSKETIETNRGPEVRVSGVVKDGSPVSSWREQDGKRTEIHLDLVKASSLFLSGNAFFEVSVGVTRIHDDQTDDALLDLAKKNLEQFVSGLVIRNP